MQTFPDYIRQRLVNNGYQFIKQSGNDVFMRQEISPNQAKPIWICYLDTAIEPEQIRRCFDFPGHVLFIVNEKLIPENIASRKETPMWLRVLHGLYMGRIYVWNDRHLFGLHFDYDSGDVSESGIIQPDELLLIETGTWLRGWPGTYKCARFYDKAWWTDFSDPEASGKQETHYYEQKKYPNGTYSGAKQGNSNARAEYEQARDHYWGQQREREQQYQQQKEQAQRQQYDSDGFAYDPQDWPNGKPPPGPSKPGFMREFARAGSPSAVKALYRTLAKQYHPDLNPDKDTTEIMQQVNLAYERFK